MTLRDEIHAKPECAALIAGRDCAAIATIMSVGRTQPNTREIGNGTILEVLGLATGNALLDVLLSASPTSPYRHVKPLIEQGRLLIGSPIVQGTVQSFTTAQGGNLLTQTEANALCALGSDPHPYTPHEIAEALFNADGTEK